MYPGDVLNISHDLLVTALMVAAPAVLTSLLVGLTVSVLQTLTSIQEQTLT
ncbi:MAG: flagellar biosynthetic protein FliQ, partial [Planctomycetales bacterium]|nr:flagellar biosynthetic protein FliQ [Planctomycetales bacterium]